MSRLVRYLLDPLLSLLPAILILLHLYLAPYTKVEESFNIQAIHDFLSSSLRIGRPKENFDHFEFSGAVPRSAIGAYIVAVVTWVVRWYAKLIGTGFSEEGREFQLIARAFLGLGNAWALWRYQIGLERSFGKGVGRWFVFFLASQFHVVFYASRTWPNMFAFILTTLAQRRLLPDQDQSRQSGAIWYLVAAGVIFRSEIAILLVVHLVPSILTSLTLGVIPYRTIAIILTSFLSFLLLTLAFDSIFWDRLVWPELAGLYFNVVQGKSSEWGTSPYHTYFSNLLPKMLKNPALLILIPTSLALTTTRKNAMKLVGPTMAFVSIYSLQPHKELRFIIYVVPPLTAAAAVAASQFSARRSILNNLITLVIFGSTILTLALSTTQLLVSSLNYPGGEALTLFQTHLSNIPDVTMLPRRSAIDPADLGVDQEAPPSRREINVHVDVLSCMTGITRFLQRPQIAIPFYNNTSNTITKLAIPVKYDKTEDPETVLHPSFWLQFDYALMEEPGKAIGKWEVVRTIYGFAGYNELVRPGEEIKPSFPYDGSGNDILQRFDRGGAPRIMEVMNQWSTVSRYEMLVLIREFVMACTGGWWYGPRMEPKIYILKQVAV